MEKRLHWKIILSIMVYIVVSVVFVFAQNQFFEETIQIYSWELFCIPVIILGILFWNSKKEKILYILSGFYGILLLLLIVSFIISMPTTSNGAEELLKKNQVEAVKYEGSFSKDTYNVFCVYGKTNLNITLPEKILGVYFFSGMENGTKHNYVVYAKDGEIVDLSKSDETGELVKSMYAVLEE